MPKVSVILPNYNHSAYLEERIESILAQTYQDFELIMIDDCSTDGSREIMEKYRGNPKVGQIVFNERNSGSAFAQWDKGISLAKGDLIWIAESDDNAHPKMLETLVSEFVQDSQCVLAFSSAMLTDTDGRQIGLHPKHAKIGKDLHLGGSKFIKKWLIKGNFVVNASGALFKKSAFQGLSEPILREYKTLRGCGDWLFWIGVARQGNVAYIHQPLNLFRQHGTNTTTALRTSGDFLLEQNKFFAALKESGIRCGLRQFKNNVYQVWYLNYSDGKNLPENKRAEAISELKSYPLLRFLAFFKNFYTK